jgi:hypothetical protein
MLKGCDARVLLPARPHETPLLSLLSICVPLSLFCRSGMVEYAHRTRSFDACLGGDLVRAWAPRLLCRRAVYVGATRPGRMSCLSSTTFDPQELRGRRQRRFAAGPS